MREEVRLDEWGTSPFRAVRSDRLRHTALLSESTIDWIRIVRQRFGKIECRNDPSHVLSNESLNYASAYMFPCRHAQLKLWSSCTSWQQSSNLSLNTHGHCFPLCFQSSGTESCKRIANGASPGAERQKVICRDFSDSDRHYIFSLLKNYTQIVSVLQEMKTGCRIGRPYRDSTAKQSC